MTRLFERQFLDVAAVKCRRMPSTDQPEMRAVRGCEPVVKSASSGEKLPLARPSADA